MKKHTFFACCSVLLLAATPALAKAPQWSAMPAACTPDRAVPWIEGASESAQAPCHCPPTSLCPTTYEEYTNPNLSKLPMKLVDRCCPIIESEKCPAGTSLAGQAKPADGKCNIRCPNDSQLAGRFMPEDGKCNPYESCPTKHYPSLAKLGIVTDHANQNLFQDSEGNTYFVEAANRNATELSIGRFSMYVNKPQWGMMKPSCKGSVVEVCPVEDFYGHRYGDYDTFTLQNQVAVHGLETLTWFGFMVTPIDHLADNLMSDAMLEAWGTSDMIQIATQEMGRAGMGYGGAEFNRGSVTMFKQEVNPAIERGAPEFFQQCTAAGGEYAVLDALVVNGNRCQYLQCRYIEEVTNTSCMTGDTKITLADGTVKALKDVTIGEQVKGKDGVHKVTALNTYQSKLRVLYGINGSGAMLTGDHPIRTTEGWKLITDDAAAQSATKPGFAKTKLAVGDTLVTDKGEVKVTDITRFPSVQPVSTYNIKVDGNASFFANGFEVRGFDIMEMKY